MDKDKRINIRLSQEDYDSMHATACLNHKSMSQFVREAMYSYMRYLDKINGLK